MEKGRKNSGRTAVQKKRTQTGARNARTVPSFFLVPHVDHTIRLLTRALLQDIPCTTCGQQMHTRALEAPVSAVVLPLLAAARETAKRDDAVRSILPSEQPQAFDPAPYVAAFRSEPFDATRKAVVSLTATPTPSSSHVLSLRGETHPVTGNNARRRAPLFRPGELPELRQFVARQGAEFSLPAFEERVRAQRAVPAGVVGVGKEVVAGTLSTMDTVSAPVRAAIGTLPGRMGFGEHTEEVLPVPSDARVPRTVAWASGVPKNLPVVDWMLTPPPAPPAWVSGVADESMSHEAVTVPVAPQDDTFPVHTTHESFLDRLERFPETVLGLMRRPARPWHAAGAFVTLLGIVLLAPLGAVSFAAKGDGVKTAIERSSKNGIAALFAAGHTAAARNVLGTADSFSAAAVSFAEARATLDGAVGGLHTIAGALPGVGQTVQAVDRLLAAADALARAGAHLAPALAPENENPLFVLTALATAMQEIRPDVIAADEALTKLDAQNVPEALRSQFAGITAGVQLLRRTVDGFPEKAEALSVVLGRDAQKRYLVVFQNASELRPTGGFIGSIAEVTVDKGVMTEIRVPKGGIYDQQGSLRARVSPPEPLRQVASRWEMQDANWFPDFPTSAEKLSWFYQKGGGPSVDGVIAVTSDVLPALLSLTGPISMPAYHRTLTADNVIEETQHIVEVEYDRDTHAPKQFIADLLEAVLQRLRTLPAQKMVAAGDLFATLLQEKTVQMYFFDEGIERVVAASGWNGAVRSDEGDALMVVDTNIGGGKTDRVVQKDGTVHTVIAADGTVTHTVTLRYTHTGIPSDPLSGTPYRDYVRVYAARGSRLLAAQGDFGAAPPSVPAGDDLTEDPLLQTTIGQATVTADGVSVWDEQGRTVFGRWLTIPAGGTTTITFVYTSGVMVATHAQGPLAGLFGDTATSYRLRVERQPGAHRALRVELTAPSAWKTVWQSPDILAEAVDPAALSRDRLYAAVFLP